MSFLQKKYKKNCKKVIKKKNGKDKLSNKIKKIFSN